MIDLTNATGSEPNLKEQIDDLFTYHPWTPAQVASGVIVRNALAAAYLAVLENAPPCSTRTRALNMIVDARMLANAAITFREAPSS